MKVNPHIFRGYDLRGLVGEDLSPELALHLGKAHGTYLKRHGQTKALVSRDSRQTSPEYAQKVAEGLSWTGLDVTDIGLQMVGMFYWAQHHLQIPGGVFVTASHNPPQFNGFKLANDYSETLVSEGMQTIRKMIEEEDYEEGKIPGKIAQQDIRPAYYKDILGRIKIDRPLKVMIDASNTSSGEIIPELARQAGCEVAEFNTEIKPDFPLGVADPTEEYIMERMEKEMHDCKADVGFTYDADGDRIGIMNEKGEPIWNDVLVALFAKDVLADHPGATIMFNTLCSKTVPETIEANGGKPFMWRTGHSFLKKKNQEIKGAFIGELSGHFFFSADFFNHDDGAYATMRLLQAMSRTNKTLSEMVTELPLYKSSPEIKVFCPDDKKVELTKDLSEKLRKDFPDAEVIDDERAGDGVRLELPDSMFVVRYSQNGPYVTIKIEAKTDNKYEELRKYLSDRLHEYPEIDWENDISANVGALDPSFKK
jgi:phosphomannomutase/phosphoglucomutase